MVKRNCIFIVGERFFFNKFKIEIKLKLFYFYLDRSKMLCCMYMLRN